MLRPRVMKTLLYKEVLRYRYNWGLLVMVFALLALSALVAAGARLRLLPGQGGAEVSRCVVYYLKNSPAEAWADYLRQNPPSSEYRVDFEAADLMLLSTVQWRLRDTLAITMYPPGGDGSGRSKNWRIDYWYPETAPAGILPYRDWIAQRSREFLKSSPVIEEKTKKQTYGLDASDPVPLVVTALILFALYLLSFNLYITSTAEEREKRQMLALLLTPAGEVELVTAKAIFYGCFSLVVGLAVAGMYDVTLLANPLIWSTIVAGSVGYVAIGTVVVTVVRRQSTVNTLSMLYLIVTSMIMVLSKIIPLFTVFRRLLIEDYLHRQLHQLVSKQPARFLEVMVNHVALLGLVAIWLVTSLYFFSKHGKSIAVSR